MPSPIPGQARKGRQGWAIFNCPGPFFMAFEPTAYKKASNSLTRLSNLNKSALITSTRSGDLDYLNLYLLPPNP